MLLSRFALLLIISINLDSILIIICLKVYVRINQGYLQTLISHKSALLSFSHRSYRLSNNNHVALTRFPRARRRLFRMEIIALALPPLATAMDWA